MNQRQAFSLFEVMVAMGVCLMGLVLILQMLGTAEILSRRSESVLQQQFLCQNQLNRILWGLDPAEPSTRSECPADPNFWYSVRIVRHPWLSLLQVEVAVWPKLPAERVTGASPPAPGTKSTDSVKVADNSPRPFRLAGFLPVAPVPDVDEDGTLPETTEVPQ